MLGQTRGGGGLAWHAAGCTPALLLLALHPPCGCCPPALLTSHRLVECLEYSGADIGKAALFIATRHWRVPLHLPEGISFTEHFDISQARLDGELGG